MLYWIAANVIVLVHLGFILFVIFGGLLARKSSTWAWIHLPAVFWGSTVEFTGWICPLTPLENWLRKRGGYEVYQEAFIDHYIMPLIYPDGYTRGFQLLLGSAVIVTNIIIYGWVFKRNRQKT